MYWLLLLLLVVTPLFGDDAPVTIEVQAEVDANAIPSLVNLTSMPSAIVNGSVNVITGDFCESDEEDVIYSPDPYVLGHTYFSSSLEEGNLGAGWNYLHHHLIEVFQPARITYTKAPFDSTPHLLPIGAMPHIVTKDPFPTLRDSPANNVQDRVRDARNFRGHNRDKSKPAEQPNPIFLSLYDPAGGRLLYKAKYDENHKERFARHFKLESKLSGYTNVVNGSLSGQTNLKNIKIRWDKKDDAFHVTLGDGTRRVYERQWKTYAMKKEDRNYAKHYRDYHLHKEVKPNGQIAIYDYNDNYEIVQIRAFNKDISHKLYSVEFDQRTTGDFAKHPTLDVRTSDGFQHTYYFKRLDGSYMHGTYSVSHIRRQGRPFTNFVYSDKGQKGKRRVVKKETEGGFYVSTKYYGSRKEQKFLKNKVREQLSPVGPGGEEVVTHRYSYHKDSDGGGHCTVRDAYNNISRHYWNKDKRLIRVSKSTSSNKHLMTERYYWGKNDTSEEGMLLTRVLEDENNIPVLAQTFDYDSQGNVIENALYGQITETAGELHIKNGKPNHESCDKQRTRYTYSDDGYNLVTSIQDPLGNFTYFEYEKETNLLTAKFICDKTTICKREFFAYDVNGLCVEHIVDDGTTKDKDSLVGALERHITKTRYRYERPRFGEPEEILVFFYNFTEKKEAFLKKTVNHFNEKGFVAKREVIDQLGNSCLYEYSYDEIGRLTSSKDPLGQMEYFEYDKHGRITKKVGTRGDVYWENEYNLAGNLIQETEKHTSGLTLVKRFEYDLLGRKIAFHDAQNNTTRYEYDSLNRLIAIAYPAIYDHNGKKKSPKRTFSYKKLGTEVTEINENGEQTTTSYNALGKVCKKVFSDNTQICAFYDIVGNTVKEVAQNGTIRELVYDAFGRVRQSVLKMKGKVLSKSEVQYNTFHPVLEIGPTGEKIAHTYDHAGRKASIKRQGTRTTKYVYDARGNIYRERTFLSDGSFIGKRYKYDALNRITYESLRDENKRVKTFKQYTYDAEGNLRTVRTSIQGKKAQSTTRYYPHGILKSKKDAKGNKIRYEVDYRHLNNHGQTVVKKRTIQPNSVVTEEIYDALGNLSTVCSYDPDGALLSKRELFYDPCKNCVRVHEFAMHQEQELNKIVTLFSYVNGKLTAITEAAGTDEEKVTRYTYNEFGQKGSDTFSDGTILHYRYDKKGRVKRYFAADKSLDYRYKYDAKDRILSLANAITGNRTTRSYNSFGELKKETLENGLTITYSYDDAGRPIELLLPDKSKISYSYSALLEKITRKSPQDEELYTHTVVERDLAGLIKSCELINKSTLTYTHDRLGRTKTIEHDNFSQKAKKFDAVGNLLSLHTIDADGAFDQQFSYDFLSQLTQENSNTYSYDSLYNRLSHNDKTYTVSSLHSVLSDSYRFFTYDAKGNRIAMKEGTQDTRYSYDALDRLVAVETSDGKRYTYTYDGFNRRVTKEAHTLGTFGWQATACTNYIYACDNEIGSTDASNNIQELRILGEGLGAEIGAAVAYELHGNTYVPIHDRIGNVVAMLDMQGRIIEHYRFDAFGNEETSTKTPLNPWRFASKRCDDETGMINFGRRYYDPTLGKWLTQDPLGLKAGPNLYAYCLNNPLTSIDLYGLQEENATQDRTITDRLRDIVSDSYHTVKDWICRGLETVVHHLPHFGSLNDRAEDHLRTLRGAPPKKHMASGLYCMALGNPTTKNCSAAVYHDGILNDFESGVNNLYDWADMFEGQNPDLYLAHTESNGLCMDLIRALANAFGIETENIKQIAGGTQKLLDRTLAENPTGHVQVVAHSNGGQTFNLSTNYFSREQLGVIRVDSIASTKMFHDRQGFMSTENHLGWSDFVSIAMDPLRLLLGQRNLKMVGHPLHFPCSQHAMSSNEYKMVLQKITRKML